jgi:hypothetical protein
MRYNLRPIHSKSPPGLKIGSDPCIVRPKAGKKAGGNLASVTKGKAMKTTALRAGLAALGLSVMASSAMAGPISAACNASSRQAASPSLCSCIQRVADSTLRSGDQRRVAQFFRDPDKAQVVRMSTKNADDAFWERYTRFGQQAEATCQG